MVPGLRRELSRLRVLRSWLGSTCHGAAGAHGEGPVYPTGVTGPAGPRASLDVCTVQTTYNGPLDALPTNPAPSADGTVEQGAWWVMVHDVRLTGG